MIIDQIKEGGIGSDLVFEAMSGTGPSANTVRIVNFVTYIYTMQHGFASALLLTQSFSQVELIE
jgi:hypothetical protein